MGTGGQPSETYDDSAHGFARKQRASDPTSGPKSEPGIFQILISDPEDGHPDFSARLDENITSFRKTYPGRDYRLYEHGDVRRFIQASFGARVVQAYDRLTPYAFKADLARYCLLYQLGGLYSDLSHRHLRPIGLSTPAAVVVFRGPRDLQPWTISNGLIFARPGRPEMAQVIRRIVRHAETRFYGASALDPTGPNLFGRVLAQSPDWHRFVIGYSEPALTIFGRRRAKGAKVHERKILPNGSTVAEKVKSRAGEVSDFIGARGNNYLHLWARRQAWGEPSIVLAGADPILKPGTGVAQGPEGLTIRPGHAGRRVTGPGWILPQGRYRVILHFRAGRVIGQYEISLTATTGKDSPLRVAAPDRDTLASRQEFRFDLHKPMQDVQMTLTSGSDFEGLLESIEVIEDEIERS